jgi:hypothetical protein
MANFTCILPISDIYGLPCLGEGINPLDEEVDVLGDQTLLLLETLLGEGVVEQSAEAGMISSGSIHDTLRTTLALRNSPRMPGPLLSARDFGKNVSPSCLVGETEIIGSDANNIAVLGVNFGGILGEAAGPLPVVLCTAGIIRKASVKIGRHIVPRQRGLIPMESC